MSKRYEDDYEVGYHKKDKGRVAYDDPNSIKEELTTEINKSVPGSNFRIVIDSGTITVLVSNDNDDPENLYYTIDELINAKFSDYEDYIVLVDYDYPDQEVEE